jgi:hypothetical protein
MPIGAAVEGSDDPGFVALLNAVVRNIVASHQPTNVWLIRIDNWFDHKWLRFSGYGLAASNIPLDNWDTVKKEFHQDKVTFPPFTPNRVISQCSYVKQGEDYCEAASPLLPHRTESQHTSASLQKRIQEFTDSAVFVWFSSNTVANGRGSVMIYRVMGDTTECWFAGFQREEITWKVASTKGIARNHVEEFCR